MFWPFRKKQVTEETEERDTVSEQMVVAALKGEKYSPNSFRIEVRRQAGKILYVAQKKWSFGANWTDMDACDTEEEARERINKSKEYDYKQYLAEQEKKSAVVINHIDV
jgi:hypothetical protein